MKNPFTVNDPLFGIQNDEEKKKLNLKRLSRFSDPFIHKILLVILLTVCHTIVTMLSLGIRHWIN